MAAQELEGPSFRVERSAFEGVPAWATGVRAGNTAMSCKERSAARCGRGHGRRSLRSRHFHRTWQAWLAGQNSDMDVHNFFLSTFMSKHRALIGRLSSTRTPAFCGLGLRSSG